METGAALFKAIVGPIPQSFRQEGIRTHIRIDLGSKLSNEAEWAIPSHLSVWVV